MNHATPLALFLAATFAWQPMAAYAGSLSQAARASLAKRATSNAAKNGEAVATVGKPRDVVVSRSQHPQAAAHIEHAQRHGQPTVLHIDRAGAAERRAEAIGSVSLKRKPAPRYERDEYPPAYTREGGHNANVRFIDPHDNRGAGAAMGAQTRDLPNGSKIRVVVGD